MTELEKNALDRSKSLPSELRAVLTIFSADKELRTKALPHVNIERQEIDWHRITINDFSSGHSAAITWAKSIWTASQPTELDIFERSTSMDQQMRLAVLRALAIAWGLS